MPYKRILRSFTCNIEIVDRFRLLGAIIFMDIFKHPDQMNNSNKAPCAPRWLTGAVVWLLNSAKLLNPCGVATDHPSILLQSSALYSRGALLRRKTL